MFLYDARQGYQTEQAWSSRPVASGIASRRYRRSEKQPGIQVSARVVSQLGTRDGVPTYAIEFVEQDEKANDFWGIAFPTAN